MARNKNDTLDIDPQEIIEQTGTNLVSAFEALTTTWALIQIGVIVGCYAVAWLTSYFLKPLLDRQLERVQSQPQLLRVLVLPVRRLQWILFAVLLWGSEQVMHLFTQPQNSYYVLVAAMLAAAALIISIASRLIQNRAFANLFAMFVWSIAALSTLGLLDDTTALLDKIALTIGDFRLSLLIVIKGLAWFAALLWLPRSSATSSNAGFAIIGISRRRSRC